MHRFLPCDVFFLGILLFKFFIPTSEPKSLIGCFPRRLNILYFPYYRHECTTFLPKVPQNEPGYNTVAHLCRNFTSPQTGDRTMDVNNPSLYQVTLGLYVIGYKEARDDAVKKFRPVHRVLARHDFIFSLVL